MNYLHYGCYGESRTPSTFWERTGVIPGCILLKWSLESGLYFYGMTFFYTYKSHKELRDTKILIIARITNATGRSKRCFYLILRPIDVVIVHVSGQQRLSDFMKHQQEVKITMKKFIPAFRTREYFTVDFNRRLYSWSSTLVDLSPLDMVYKRKHFGTKWKIEN